MDKIFYIAFLILAATPVQAQLKEIEPSGEWQTLGVVKYVGAAKASLRFLPAQHDTTYLLVMRDARYELKNYFSIRFRSDGEALAALYDILLSFFQKENRKNKDYQKIFNLGDERVHVQHFRQLTGNQIMLTTHDGYILLGEGEIKKLFGKK
jgi:hypothetical protein